MITKYRGLSISDNNKGQWVYGNLIVDGNYAYIVNGVIECNDQYITIAEWCPVDHKTIGAFTGLVDVNGKEIFEGDILKCTSISGFLWYETVSWDSTLAGFATQQNGYDATAINYTTDSKAITVEIIGNVYEHNHLLK